MTRIYLRELQGPLGTEGMDLCFDVNTENKWYISESSWGPVGEAIYARWDNEEWLDIPEGSKNAVAEIALGFAFRGENMTLGSLERELKARGAEYKTGAY
jgi:hypothetical protein